MSEIILSRKYQTTSVKNPGNKWANSNNGRQTPNTKTNLINMDRKVCNSLTPSYLNLEPKPSVKSFSNYVKNKQMCCKNNVKLLNQSHYDISSFVKQYRTKNSECNINNNNFYKDNTIPCRSYKKNISGFPIPINCNPIVKVTDTPDIESYTNTKYMSNNCLPNIITDINKSNVNNNNKSSNFIDKNKLRYNIEKGICC